MPDAYVIEESPVSHFAMIPKLVDDLGLSATAYRLYGHLKQVTGEEGVCWQSQAALEKACGLSNRTIVRAKRELQVAGLVRVEVGSYHGHPQHLLYIVDIWKKNHDTYRCTTAPDSTLKGDQCTIAPNCGAEQHPTAVYNSTCKNNPIIRTQDNNPTAAAREAGLDEIRPRVAPHRMAIFAVLWELPGWLIEVGPDLLWQQGFCSEWPRMVGTEFAQCRDFHDGRKVPDHKGTWKNRFGQWAKHMKGGDKDARQPTGTAAGHTGRRLPTDDQRRASLGLPAKRGG